MMAGQEFGIPLKLADLEDGDGPFALKELDERAISAPHELAKTISQELGFKEVVDIEQEEIFAPVYSLVRHFTKLPATAKVLLVDTLCTNLLLLNPSIHSLVTSTKDSTEDGGAEGYASLLQSHRNALKIYVLFLHEICAAEEKEAPAAAAEKAATAPPGGRRRAPSKKNAASNWDWDFQRPRVIRPLAGALEADLKELYRMDQPEEALLQLFTRTAFLMLENPAVPRDRDADFKSDVYKILALCCAKYDHTLPVTTTLIHSLLKYEHSPGPLAEVATLVATKYDDPRLAAAVLREIGQMDPRELLRDVGGAKNVSAFLVELAERLPKIVARNFSLVMVHMNGEQYHMRSALVMVLGRIVAKAFDEKEENTAAEQARLKSKQALLDVLLERVRDVNSFTRTRVLQAWSYLCEENQVHLGLFNRVTEIATGRLEDKASNVRKAALQLLSTLIVCNPFASDLRVAPYESTLRTFQEKLDKAEEDNRPSDEELLAAAFGPGSGGIRAGEQAERNPDTENGTGEASADEDAVEDGTRTDAPAEPDLEPDQEPSSQSTQPEPESNSQSTQPEAAGSEQNAASLTRLRAMVASLDAAVKFTKQLAKTMPVFDKLLASASVTDVTETIQFLELAKSRKCEDVDDRLRLMLPLIFCREASVREAVSAACEKLYVKVSEEGTGQRGLADPKLAAKNLVGLTMGASLGTLASLEAIVVDFMHRELITHGMVRALWDIFEGRGEAITPAHSRGALAVLTMAAKGNPDVITSKLDSLLRHGLGPRAQKDPLMARYTCVALQRIALGGEREKLESRDAVFGALTWLVKSAPLPDESWYSAAEQAVGAIYALHPTPEVVCARLVREMAGGAFGRRKDTPGESGDGIGEREQGENVGEGGEKEAGIVSEGEGETVSGDAERRPEEVSAQTGEEQRTGEDADGPADAVEGASESADVTGAEQAALPEVAGEADEPDYGVNAPAGGAAAAKPTANGANSHPADDVFGCSVGALSRFLFVVGHVALKHLVYVESCARDVRRLRVDKDKEAAQAAADRRDAELAGVEVTQQTQESAEETDKINEELGVGSASADAHLDSLSEAAEREILSPQNLVGHVAPVVARICRSSALLQEHPLLRSSALLALCKLMAVDAHFCEANLQLLFTLVRNAPEEAVRCNCVVALGDLAFRFPNLVEPWTEHVYARLRDESVLVRKNTVMVLTHLILNDMMKVKGHISSMAMCLEDEDERIRDLTKLFFHELSKKGNNPIYNLLPDMLSRLSADANVPPESFRAILEYMLGFIEKDKQTEGLIEKLCNRFPQTTEVKQWRDIAYCLAQLKFTDRGLKKLVEHFKSYQDTLFDDEVVEHFRTIISKAKKFAKPEMKAAVDEFEKQLTATHVEKKEDWTTAQNAARRAAKGGGAATAGASQEEGDADQSAEAAGGDEVPAEEQTADAPEADLPASEEDDALEEATEPEGQKAKGRRKAAGNGKRAAKKVDSASEEEDESEIEDGGSEDEIEGQDDESGPEMAAGSPSETGAKRGKERKKATRRKVVESEDEDSGLGSESEEEGEGSISNGTKAGGRGEGKIASNGKSSRGRRSAVRAGEESAEDEEGFDEKGGEEMSDEENEVSEDEAKSEDEKDTKAEKEGDQTAFETQKAVANSSKSHVRNSSGLAEKPVKEEALGRGVGVNKQSGAGVNRRSAAGVNRPSVKSEPEEEDETGDENTSPPNAGKGARKEGSKAAKAAAAHRRRRAILDSDSEDDTEEESDDECESSPKRGAPARQSKRFSQSSENERRPLQPLR